MRFKTSRVECQMPDDGCLINVLPKELEYGRTGFPQMPFIHILVWPKTTAVNKLKGLSLPIHKVIVSIKEESIGSPGEVDC